MGGRSRLASEEGEGMTSNQIFIKLAAKIACVALVVTVIFPLGRMLFPYVGDDLGSLSFGAIEAVLATTLGFGIYSAVFG
jgi:hypothetical protein